MANRLKLDISDIEIIDMRADGARSQRRRAKHLAEACPPRGYTFEAYDKMYERSTMGMSMV